VVEDSAKATNKKLTQGMSEHNKAMSSAKTDAAKADVVCECYSALTYIFIMQKLPDTSEDISLTLECCLKLCFMSPTCKESFCKLLNSCFIYLVTCQTLLKLPSFAQ
jgi:hypothetical protein